MPEVNTLKVKDPKVKQPPYPMRLLPANTLHIGTSGSGQSAALIRTLIDRDKLGAVLTRTTFSVQMSGWIRNIRCCGNILRGTWASS